MSLKKLISNTTVSDTQYVNYNKHVTKYKKLVLKTKKNHIKKFHSEIRNLKTSDPKEFWKFIKSDSNSNTEKCSVVFSEFVDHVRELNSGSYVRSTDAIPGTPETATFTENDAINQPFSVLEIKTAIKHFQNDKSIVGLKP